MSSQSELVYHFEPRIALNGDVLGWKLHRRGDVEYDKWPDTKFNTVKAALEAAERAADEKFLGGTHWSDADVAKMRARAPCLVNTETGEITPLPATQGLPTDSAARKALPIFSGVLNYFPDALAAVAQVSKIGNDQHNPGQPLHWSKGKSTDHDDCAVRHLIDAKVAPIDTDGGRHRAKHAWRALAALQIEIEAERAGLSYADYIAELEKLA